MEWDAKYLGFVPSEMFPQCEKLFADYVAGVNADATPVSSACEKNTTSRLNSIIEKHYPHHKANGFDGVAASAWMSRKDLESARYSCMGKVSRRREALRRQRPV